MSIINGMLTLKRDFLGYVKETYLKFIVTYLFTLIGFCFFFSVDLFSTFKTITGISLFFYILFFVYYIIEKNKNNSKEKKKNKKSIFNLFKKRKFDNKEVEDLKKEMKKFLEQVNKV